MEIKLTRAGFEKIQKELKHLREVKRPKVVKAIEVAREKGDLRENAEYDAAKEAQGHLEKRIFELERQLTNSEIIDDRDIDSSKAYLGATILLKDLNKRELTCLVPIVIFCFWIGIYPSTFLGKTDATVEKILNDAQVKKEKVISYEQELEKSKLVLVNNQVSED